MNRVTSLAVLIFLALSAAPGRTESRTLQSPKAAADPQNGWARMKRPPRPQWHTIKVTPRPGRPKIHWYDKLNPIWWVKNADDPVPPDWYKPDDKHRVTKWHFRNPFHNFTSYVIGISDKESLRSGRYPELVSNPNGGWNFAVSRRRLLLLPFIDYRRGKFEFYFGWRKGGNFGIKLNFSQTRPPKTPPPANPPANQPTPPPGTNSPPAAP